MKFFKKVLFLLFLSFFILSCNNEKNELYNGSEIEVSKPKAKINEKLRKDEDYKKLKENIKALKYKDSVFLINSLVKKYPKTPELLYLFAVITKNIDHDPLEAIKILEVVIALDYNYSDAWKLLGDLYYIRGEFKKSIKSWELAIEGITNNANLYYKLAYVYYTVKDYNLAVKYFLKSLKLDKTLEWSYYYLADINFRNLRKLEEAESFIKKGLEVLPNNKNLMQKLAIFKFKLSQYELAIKWNKEVLKQDKDDNFAIENISNSYSKLKKYDKSIEWLNKVFKKKPKSIYYAKKLAELYKLSNRLEKSIEYLNFAYNIKKDANLKDSIARLYLILGNKEKFKEILNELSKSKDPEDLRVYEYLKVEMK